MANVSSKTKTHGRGALAELEARAMTKEDRIPTMVLVTCTMVGVCPTMGREGSPLCALLHAPQSISPDHPDQLHGLGHILATEATMAEPMGRTCGGVVSQ